MNHFNGRRLALQWALCLPASSLLLNHAYANDGVLRVSAIPDEAPTELQRKFTPLGNYLSAQTGLKVVFTPVTDYAAVVEALAAGKIDLHLFQTLAEVLGDASGLRDADAKRCLESARIA